MASCRGRFTTEVIEIQIEDLYSKYNKNNNDDFKRNGSFVLSRQMPPIGSSPPSPPQGNFVHNYLKHLLKNKRFSLDQEMYKEYDN